MKSKAHTRYKLPDGKRCPGVTTITGQLGWNKQILVNWANKKGLAGVDTNKYVDDKAEIGTLAHKIVTDSLLDQTTCTDDYSMNQIRSAQNSADSFFNWAKGKKIEPILIETPLVSEIYGFGGTLDIFAKIDGVNELIDLKTSSRIYDEMVIQVSAYEFLIEENKKDEFVEKVRILNIPRTRGESFIERDIGVATGAAAWKIFLKLLEIYKLKKELK